MRSQAVAPPPTPSSTVRFVLDGEIVELENPDPTRTILQYLREDLRRTGTKEGCAEGDCGACTVVIGTPGPDGLCLEPANACIRFVPTLDGTELFTVESLAAADRLHPVQRALVEMHGSQCGFCTPGFVMSLFALFKDAAFNAIDRPGRRDIDDALAGNLCRCTGYRPIIAAADAMYEHSMDESDWLRSPGRDVSLPVERQDRLRAVTRDRPLDICRDGRRFTAPNSIDEVTAALAARPAATILAGGTDIGLWVTKGHRDLVDIIHIGRVRELQRIDVAGGNLEIGAAVSLADATAEIVVRYPGLAEMFARFASPPIRTTGTLVGNLANGSPIGDSLPPLMALESTLLLRSADGQREVPLDAFYVDYGVKALEPGEFVEAVRVPLPDGDPIVRCYKVSKRFDQDISAVCAAFNIALQGPSVTTARIAFGGMAATVRRAPRCEAALLGQPFTPATIARAAAALADDYTPLSDMRASSGYRLRVAQNLLRRFHADANDAAATNVYNYGRAG